MCSIVEEDFGDDGGAHAMVEDAKTVVGGLCKKCSVEKVLARLMCEQCLMTSIRHKFRAALGSTKIVKRHSKVLLSFTGSEANICLLDMVKFAFEQESYKRLCFDMDLVYVDDNCATKDGQELAKRIKLITEVREVLEQFPNFKCYYVSVAETVDRELHLIETVSTDDVMKAFESEKKFLQTFNALQSLSSKQDLIASARNEVLRHAATALNCQYVFLSDISITLATRLLTNMSLGRGSSAAFDVAFCDDRIDSIKFIRPIKDLGEDETSCYVKLQQLKTISKVNHGDDHGQFASIQNLTSKFINDLQQNFSSTVSTVYRTCSKIAPAENAPEVSDEIDDKFVRSLNVSNMNQRCMMCKSFLDYHNSETLFAINYSRYVSEYVGNDDHLKSIDHIDEKVSKEVNGSKKHLCHGCRNIFFGLDDEALNDIF